MSANELKAAIFDVDGVIVDTVALHFGAWKKMFAEYGVSFTFEQYKKKVDGIPRIDGARAILRGLDKDELGRAARRKQAYFLRAFNRRGAAVFQDAVFFIDELAAYGIKIAAISSSRNCRYVIGRLGLSGKLNAIISARDIRRGKPDPQIFLAAADKLGVLPSECVVFEDAKLGVEAALNGGMFCVGIDRHNDNTRLRAADMIISSFGEISLDKLKERF